MSEEIERLVDSECVHCGGTGSIYEGDGSVPGGMRALPCQCSTGMLTAIAALRAERDAAIETLRIHGFVRCDIPACNCDRWHPRYGLYERFQEFKQALDDAGHPPSNANGNLACGALAELVAERDKLAIQVRQADERGDAAMNRAHKAEDERDAAQAEVARLREALEHLIERADTSDDCQYGTLSTSYVRDIARAALESKT